ncbi:sigma-70 family RNA polymerase sigma factor [Rubinisphaera sp.]|uniref:RNA polymerase sigma factor n=1 Tax=Rubinisphaera sp. TaxID=2024857 RepID=UPI0025CC2A06|nr:sigma-70 family RNA polymerase sigma factor [Rubinisphaera sp.]
MQSSENVDADEVEEIITRLNAGDEAAKEELITAAYNRMMAMTRKIKRSYQNVNRWEQTEDIFQQAAVRMHKALVSMEINDEQHFWRLTAQHIRWTLIEVSRKHYGPNGVGKNHVSVGNVMRDEGAGAENDFAFDPAEVTGDIHAMETWGDFHQMIERLPEEERQVVDLLWYHGMTQDAAAKVLKITTRRFRRLWRQARMSLHEMMEGRDPLD